MKKILLIYLLYFMFNIISINTFASHTSFQEITLNEEGKLLKDYTDDELEELYKEVSKRKFMGWNVYKVNEDVKASFIKETLFSYYNDGTSPIKYEYKYEEKDTSKISLSASGGIKTESSTTEKGFKNGLTKKLDIDASYTKTEETKIEETIKMDIDPGCKAVVYVCGEGVVFNGVASMYVFFIRVHTGGWEYFITTTQYRRMEKTFI